MKMIRIIQSFISLVSLLWVFIYLTFILTTSQSDANVLIGNVAFILFFITYYSIWIWFVVTLIASLVVRRFIYEKWSLGIFVVGAFFFLYIVTLDPGGYILVILD